MYQCMFPPSYMKWTLYIWSDTLKIDLHVRMKEFSMHGVTPRFKWPRYPKKKNKKSAQQTTLSGFVDLFSFD